MIAYLLDGFCVWRGETLELDPSFQGSVPSLTFTPPPYEYAPDALWKMVGGEWMETGEPEPRPVVFPPLPESVSLTQWLSTLHTRAQRIAWNRAREMARLLAVGSPDLDGESEETLTALETVGEWFMVVSLTGEVTLADDAIYAAGTTLGVYADPAEIARIKSNQAPA